MRVSKSRALVCSVSYRTRSVPVSDGGMSLNLRRVSRSLALIRTKLGVRSLRLNVCATMAGVLPGRRFCSIVTMHENGRMVEVATVGRDGMVGLGAMVGRDLSNALTTDRMETDEFPLTQQLAAMMLASHPMVTIAAGALQKAGWLSVTGAV